MIQKCWILFKSWEIIITKIRILSKRKIQAWPGDRYCWPIQAIRSYPDHKSEATIQVIQPYWYGRMTCIATSLSRLLPHKYTMLRHRKVHAWIIKNIAQMTFNCSPKSFTIAVYVYSIRKNSFVSTPTFRARVQLLAGANDFCCAQNIQPLFITW